jgi:hypothetical protein
MRPPTLAELRQVLRDSNLPDDGDRATLVARIAANGLKVPGPEWSWASGLDPGVRMAKEETPPISSLVRALETKDPLEEEAIVLRGYLGRSNIVERATQYLDRAKAAAANVGERTRIEDLKTKLLDARDGAEKHVPWRLYLTTRLDRYVDFHESDLIAWRPEVKPDRKDTFTVWLRVFGSGQKPIPYRVVEETRIGPSFAVYLGGDLIDDYLVQSDGSSSAWGDQSAFGRKPGTGTTCGMFGRRPATGTVCGE